MKLQKIEIQRLPISVDISWFFYDQICYCDCINEFDIDEWQLISRVGFPFVNNDFFCFFYVARNGDFFHILFSGNDSDFLFTD